MSDDDSNTEGEDECDYRGYYDDGTLPDIDESDDESGTKRKRCDEDEIEEPALKKRFRVSK